MRLTKDGDRPKGARRAASARLVGLAILLGAFPAVAAAQSGPYDHLECFRLQARGTAWTANAHAGDALEVALPASLTPPFAAFGSGVELLPGARPVPQELCVAVHKDPSRAPVGSDVGNAFACYDVKYPRSSGSAEVSLMDQFGAGVAVTREGRRKLCVPTTLP